MYRYHQATFELLQQEGDINEIAIQEINDFQQASNLLLPLSVREWYSMKHGVDLICRFYNEGQAVPLQSWKTIVTSIGDLIVFLAENQNNWIYAFLIDGTDDPPVFVNDLITNEWELYINTFSKFIFAGAWDASFVNHTGQLMIITKTFSLNDLIFMKQHYTEGIQTFLHPGSTNFRFFNTYGKITIYDYAPDYTEWWFQKISNDKLLALFSPIFDRWKQQYIRGDILYFYRYDNDIDEKIWIEIFKYLSNLID